MIDVFRIGVHLGMTSNAAQMLGQIMRHLTGVQGSINHINQNLGKMALLAGGAVAAFAGFEALKGLWHLVEASKELNHELTKLQIGARLTDAQTNAAKSLAFKTSINVAGTGVAENVKQQRELFGVFGNMETAQKLLPEVAMGSRAVSKYVDKDTDLAQIAIRALELRGHITKDHKVDPVEFSKEFDSMVRSIVASEGLVDPQKLFAFIKQAGPAARNMSSDTMWGMAPAVMNALGSERAGTATMSFFTQFAGGVVAGERVASAMEKAGMLTHGKWHTKRGGKVTFDKDAVPDMAGFMDHPFTWLHDHMEAMKNMKGKDGKPLYDMVSFMQAMFQIPSRATTARLMNDLDANWPVILNEEKRYKRMPGIQTIFNEQNQKDLTVNLDNLHKAWITFAAALGEQGVPSAIAILTKLKDALNYLTQIVIAHPYAAKQILEISAALSAVLAVGGTAAVAITGIKGITAALRGLIALFGAGAAGGAGAAAAGGAGATAGAGGAAGAGGGLGGTIAKFGVAGLGVADAYLFYKSVKEKGLEATMNDISYGITHPNVSGKAGHPGSDNKGTLDPWGPGGVYRSGPNLDSHKVQLPPEQVQSLADRIASGLKSMFAGQTLNVNMVNARDLANGVSNHQADQINRPASGSATPDLKMNPFMPGLPAGWIAP